MVSPFVVGDPRSPTEMPFLHTESNAVSQLHARLVLRMEEFALTKAILRIARVTAVPCEIHFAGFSVARRSGWQDRQP